MEENVKVLGTYKLGDLMYLDKIISITKVNSVFGHPSLAIAFKGYATKSRYGSLGTLLPGCYGMGPGTPLVIYISMDKFTHRVPANVAIPREYFKYIKIKEKQYEGSNMSFLKATITKKVVF